MLWQHKGLVITQHLSAWIQFVMESAYELVRASAPPTGDNETVTHEIAALSSFMQSKLTGLIDPTSSTEDVVLDSSYDILSWLGDPAGRPFSTFKENGFVRYRFYFDEARLAERTDTFLRCGTDITGLARILAKTTYLHRMFRRVEAVPATSTAREVSRV